MPQTTDEPLHKPHVCHCGRGFLRKEHLVRHQASHRDAAHVCPVCTRSFTRSDLLRRHVRGHTETRVPGRRIRQACDACHARKTRCTGALPCHACVERSITCTFHGHVPYQQQAGDADDAPSDPQPAQTGEEKHNGEGLPPNTYIGDKYTFLRSLVIGGPSESDRQRPSPQLVQRLVTAPGELEMLLGVLKDGSMASLQPVIETSTPFGAWAERCTQSYFGRVHDAWAILHAPCFRIATDNLLVAASVILLGILADQDAPPQAKIVVDACHGLMVERHLQKLVVLEGDVHATPWPMEWYQAVLFSIILGFCIGGAHVVAKARLLCGLFVAHLRCVGMFDSEAAARHVARHFPGTFAPYNTFIQDRRARLASYLFKVDALLSLTCGQPPNMHLEELDVPVPQAYASWNAFGLAVAAKRMTTAHSRRISQPLLGHLRRRGPASTELLVEDIELGLCGVARDVWSCGAQKQSGQVDADAVRLVLGRLEGWRRQLERLQAASQAMPGSASHESLHSLLSAYRGDDDSQPEGEWEPLAAQRLACRIREASSLHGALDAHLHGLPSEEHCDRIRHSGNVTSATALVVAATY